MVSSYRITPLMYCSSPSAVSKVCRYARRFSSVQGTPTDSNRFWHVLELSSAARIPFPGATIILAVFFRRPISIAKLLHMLSFNKSDIARMCGHDVRVRHDVVGGEEYAVAHRPAADARRGEALG